jgi:hypothetical protein
MMGSRTTPSNSGSTSSQRVASGPYSLAEPFDRYGLEKVRSMHDTIAYLLTFC